MDRPVGVVAEVLPAAARPVCEHPAEEQGPLFGSDFPLITPDRWLADFAEAPFKDEVRPLVLKENAARLLGLGDVPDTVVFIPAWNEEQNLPAVLDELRAGLPDADVLVVDDGSTDGTAEIARGHGAELLSFGENRGLRAGSRPDTRMRGSTATPSRPRGRRRTASGRRARAASRNRPGGEADVAVGSRFASGSGYAEYATRRARAGDSAPPCSAVG